MMSSPLGTPKSPEQSERSKKYDRQLRLWGDHGQMALEKAHVCLLNATATGTEILKSLVLPGCGAFTIIDGNVVTGADVGNNFFLTEETIGKSRSKATTELLMEMNPDVQGDYVDELPQSLIQNNPNFFSSFTLVIATSLQDKTLIQLSNLLWDLNIPLIYCRSYGLIGSIRIQVKEHICLEAHPDNELSDLRLDMPFPSLVAHMDSLDIDSMDKKERNHVPYLIILYKALQIWKEKHKTFPSNYKERLALKDIVQRLGSRDNKDNVLTADEENFTEAIKAVNTVVNVTKISSSTSNIMNNVKNTEINSEMSPFWLKVCALKEFVKNEGQGNLPVRGTIPDMTADSEKYIKLQNVYRQKFEEDADAVYHHMQQLLNQIGRSQESIPEAEVRMFCKHAHHMIYMQGTSIANEYDAKAFNVTEITQNIENPDSDIVYYIMLRGVDRFYREYNAYPGEFNENVEPDIMKLKACISKLLSEWGCQPLAKDDYVHEICRYGAAELHSIAAYIGGCAAQEAIKLITKQYIPLNNTFIYNAINVSSSVFKL